MSELICYCFQVSKKELVQLIVDEGLDTVEALSLRTNACRGCQGCFWDIEELIEEHLNKPENKEG